MSDDQFLDPNSILAGWGPNFLGCAERAGRPLDTQLTMKASFEKAGFVNTQEKLYKCPIGAWPRDKIFKDAGRVNMERKFLRARTLLRAPRDMCPAVQNCVHTTCILYIPGTLRDSNHKFTTLTSISRLEIGFGGMGNVSLDEAWLAYSVDAR